MSKIPFLTATALASQLLLSPVTVWAQAASAPAEASSKPTSDLDRAKRDADKVLQFIKFHASRPAPKPEPPAPAPAPTPIRQKVTPAPKPAPVAATTTPAASATAPSTAAPATAVAPAPAPAVAATAEPTSGPASAALGLSAPAAGAAPGGSLTPSPAQQAASVPAPAPAPLPEPEPEDEGLQLVSKVDPELPRQLANSIREGSVMVRFTVKTDGSVGLAEAVKSSNKKLVPAAVAAVKQWKFKPLTRTHEGLVEIGFKAD